MDESEKLEHELEDLAARERRQRVPRAVLTHWKGCKKCYHQFGECKEGSLYHPAVTKLARSPCSSWKPLGLEGLPEE